MPAKWIFSSTFLPLAGEPVDFMLEDRDTPISGIFAEGRFHSRWANFDVERVQSWRAVEGDQVVAPIAVVADIAGRRTWASTLQRIVKQLVVRTSLPAANLAAQSACPISGKSAMAAGTINGARKRYPDSNQTTS